MVAVMGSGAGWKCMKSVTTILVLALSGCSGLVVVPEPEPEITKPVCETGSALGETTVSYNNDVLPILTRVGCLASACHGGSNPAVQFSLSSYSRMFQPGAGATLEGACPIVPGDPDASYLIEKLGPSPRTGRQMPDRQPPLSDEDFQLIVTWIREGAGEN